MNRRKTPPPKKHQISNDKLIEAMKKKKACNDKAQKFVESLISNEVNKDEFLNNLKFINPGHYDDIVEERSIIKQCGYALCSETLIDVPNKQYIISLKAKKVYDITDRKKFCSKFCYSSSLYIQEQILTSPLWIRDENDSPEFYLLDQEVNEK